MASFCGGGVGVLTALLIVEANNAKMQVGLAGQASFYPSVELLLLPGLWHHASRGRCCCRGARRAGRTPALARSGSSTADTVGPQVPSGSPLIRSLHSLLPRPLTCLLQEKRRCIYCEGTGYLTCGNCVGRGMSGAEVCANCAGTGKASSGCRRF